MNTRKITLLGPEGTNITLLTIFLILNFVSWLTLFTLSGALSFNLQNSVFRQISFSILAVLLFFAITYVSLDQIYKYTFIFYGVISILLILLFATEPKEGVRRWFDLGVVDFQPSEYIKIGLVLFI